MTHAPTAGKALLAVVAVICVATSAPPPVPPPNVPMWSIASSPLVLPCGTADVWVAKSGKTGLGITVRVAATRTQPTASDAQQPAQGSPMQVATSPDSPTSPGSMPIATSPDSTPPSPGTAAPATIATGTLPGCDATVAAKLRFPDRVFEGVLVIRKRGDELKPNVDIGDPDTGRGMPDRSDPDAQYHYLGFELDNEARWNRGDRSATVELDIYIDGNKQSWTLPATHAYREWPATRRR